jgi:outer membrane protein OmpA-like peptidoglycan-associated protein
MYCIQTKPTLENPRLNMLDEINEWLLISDVYVAKGGEEWITIGNFKPDKEMKILRRTAAMGAKESNTWAYVFIDDVVVKPVKTKSECSCENEITASLVHDPPLELDEYDNVKLDAILFDFDEDVLTEKAQQEIEEIYKMLRKNKSMFLVISGHTDIVGNDGYNIDLSKRRAERVIGALEEKGIAKDRLSIEFAGSHEPVADNTTEEGRAQNRRVEFSIRQKKYELIH